MSVEIFDVEKDAKAAVSVTESAAAHLLKQVQRKGKSAVRLSVKESGCTGFMYVMEEVDAPETGDVTITAANELKLFVDPGSLPYLRGTELDMVQQGVNRNLQFNNPNVSVACGCGESFDIAAS
ncbi:MAG: iron-sulfur cluster assembly accessory protein [Gammaproteobacteria bacterium]|jgi:iron-sulfur cluster assembly accessory protein|nr:iron-sulfur cluster assembly accessory protein [Gammaproteobacteria bacterium]|tara:strand:- start:4912 stop:5283 length:372 start_codon:yes stop_codon:yes gene_type:complete